MYTTGDYFIIADAVLNKKPNVIQEKYPELVKFETQIYNILVHSPDNCFEGWQARYFIEEVINFVKEMDGHNYTISDDMFKFIGDHKQSLFIGETGLYMSKIDCLLDFDQNIYENKVPRLAYYFGQVIDRRVKEPLPITLDDPKLEKLSEITKLLHDKYLELYIDDYYIVDLLIMYGYYHNDNYDPLYSFLDDSEYYIEKLFNNGIIGSIDVFYSLCSKFYEIYPNCDVIFKKPKEDIK